MIKNFLSLPDGHKDLTPSSIVSQLCSEWFQIEALDAVPVALFAFLRKWNQPKEAIPFAISMGGDTDSIGSMTGALIGVLWGPSVFPPEWLGRVEKETQYGKNYILDMGKKLGHLFIS